MNTTKYDVYRVTNVSKHESVYVGSVNAWDLEDARRIACEDDLIKDFETFTVAEHKLRDGVTVEARDGTDTIGGQVYDTAFGLYVDP